MAVREAMKAPAEPSVGTLWGFEKDSCRSTAEDGRSSPMRKGEHNVEFMLSRLSIMRAVRSCQDSDTKKSCVKRL